MLVRFRPIVSALAVLTCGPSSCGNRQSSPTGWAITSRNGLVGLPADARRSDEYMKERERKGLEPAPPKDATATAPDSYPTSTLFTERHFQDPILKIRFQDLVRYPQPINP
jgi:hypothetical protein